MKELKMKNYQCTWHYIRPSVHFKTHLHKVTAKLKTRISLINKLAGTSWGASMSILRTSSIALAYLVAEYCTPVWEGSSHIQVVDIQLKKVMHTISDTVLSINTQWLTNLSNIKSPSPNQEIPC